MLNAYPKYLTNYLLSVGNPVRNIYNLFNQYYKSKLVGVMINFTSFSELTDIQKQLLRTAMQGDSKKFFNLVYDDRADFNFSFLGFTPLMIAVHFRQNDYQDIIETLLFNRVDIHYCSPSGLNALDIARINQDEWAIHKLEQEIDRLCQLDSRLLKAAKTGNLEDVNRLLFDLYINVNCTNAYGQTPLMVAAHFQNKDYLKVMESLIERRADVYAKTSKGKNAFDIVRQNNDTDALKILNSALNSQDDLDSYAGTTISSALEIASHSPQDLPDLSVSPNEIPQSEGTVSVITFSFPPIQSETRKHERKVSQEIMPQQKDKSNAFKPRL